jgi:hydrogenase maturation protease
MGPGSERKSRLLIIGIGNPFRNDDAAGLHATRLLKKMDFESSIILEHSGEGASLMEMWKGADAVILIDAVSSGSPPGTIHRLQPANRPLPAQMFQSSTHAFSLPHAVEMARALNQLPPHLLVFGIEGQNFQAGSELSPEVRSVLPEVANQVRKAVAHLKNEIGHGV